MYYYLFIYGFYKLVSCSQNKQAETKLKLQDTVKLLVWRAGDWTGSLGEASPNI